MTRPSLFQTLSQVKKQVDYNDFAVESKHNPGQFYIEPLYNELCLIIAEMYVTPPERLVRIRGQEMEAATVQEVYSALTHDHVELVADNFRQQTQLIRKKTAYLQTALYNVLFEFDSHFINLVSHDLNC